MLKLGVNIDYFAVLRAARGIGVPNLTEVAQEVIKNGADAVVMHLRQDRRHIQDKDVADLKRQSKAPLHLQISADPQLCAVAVKAGVGSVGLLPEKPGELTTQGGFDLQNAGVQKEVAKAIQTLKKKGCKVSVLLESNAAAIRLAKRLGADTVELNARPYGSASSKARGQSALEDLHVAGRLVRELGLGLHIGQDLDYDNVAEVTQIPEVAFLNIGFAVVARSLSVGLASAVDEMLEIMRSGAEEVVG